MKKVPVVCRVLILLPVLVQAQAASGDTAADLKQADSHKRSETQGVSPRK